MIDVALIGLIRRWHIRDQLSLREISRRLGISRNTVRRYIRSETIEPVYADRKSVSALDKYAFKLSTWLKTESTKSRKQKRSVKQMYLDLRALGYEGSYDRVAAFARQWKLDQLERVNSASKGTHRGRLGAARNLVNQFKRFSAWDLRGSSQGTLAGPTARGRIGWKAPIHKAGNAFIFRWPKKTNSAKSGVPSHTKSVTGIGKAANIQALTD
ncbi:MAG: transposase [Herbaspirillum sp.]|nr:transposase [Herbaspirillum sp.]